MNALQHCFLSIDQGTTSSRAIVFSEDGNIITSSQMEFAQIYPNDGWVEHDPEEIWLSTLSVCRDALKKAKTLNANVVAIGVTNQRETTLVWDKKTGKPIYNAIVWQDRRTAPLCQQLQQQGLTPKIQEKTGLLLDPYFSATKVSWILDHVEGARDRAELGELAFGTVDSFLIWRLTGGKMHATDATNASRTNLFNINTLCWDDELLSIFNVPNTVLPEVKQCADDFGITADGIFEQTIPICGVAGDQQAAAIGQCCFSTGSIKSTYGTGCFVLLNTGNDVVRSKHNLLSTVAYQIKGQTHYALEGSIFIAGAGVQWLRDGLSVIDNARETEALARSVDDNHGVYLVPAFAGLGAPHWDPDCRGAVFGLTRGTTNAHLARATLEAVCYQTADLLDAMAQEGVSPQTLRVDGGMVANDWLCQFLADMLEQNVERPAVMETTALGVAFLAGLQAGVYDSLDDLREKVNISAQFTPSMSKVTKDKLLSGWQSAVKATKQHR